MIGLADGEPASPAASFTTGLRPSTWSPSNWNSSAAAALRFIAEARPDRSSSARWWWWTTSRATAGSRGWATSRCRYAYNKHNRGFAFACNQGARDGQGGYTVFLNPDTRVFPETLEPEREFMVDQRNAGIGICGGRVVNEDGDEEFFLCPF